MSPDSHSYQCLVDVITDTDIVLPASRGKAKASKNITKGNLFNQMLWTTEFGALPSGVV